MRKTNTRITRWFHSGSSVAGFSAVAGWVVACAALASPLLGGEEPLTLKGHARSVHSVAFSADGKRLASASQDKTVKVWDSTSGQELLTLKGHTLQVNSVAFSPDGKRLASASLDGSVKLWNATSGQELLTLKGRIGLVMSVAFSPDGKRLASAGGGPSNPPTTGVFMVWDVTSEPDSLTSGQELLSLTGHTAQVNSVAFSADGKRLASGSQDQTVKVWDATTGRQTLTFKAVTLGGIKGVAFSPDGTRLAVAGQENVVKIWDATSGQEQLSLKGGGLCVAFSPDGQRLASGVGVKVWDSTSGQEFLALKGHTNLVLSVAFSPDGKRLASASSDQTVKVWDIARERIDGFETSKKGHGHHAEDFQTQHIGAIRQRGVQARNPSILAARNLAMISPRLLLFVPMLLFSALMAATSEVSACSLCCRGPLALAEQFAEAGVTILVRWFETTILETTSGGRSTCRRSSARSSVIN